MRKLSPRFSLFCFGELIACGFSTRAEQATFASSTSVEMPTTSSACPPDRVWDSDTNMCMPGAAKAESAIMFHLNQFMLYSSTSGPLGRSRLTGPGMWMLTYDNDLTPRNHLHIDVMGTPEQLTVGAKGTPQLLQTENIDAMHPHDTIMALEFRDVVALAAGNKQHLTLLFAPRGEAAAGPIPFMHRDSAEGNPDAPLGHTMQDAFHDVSTVFGAEYQIAQMTVEATAFSGRDISWPLPLHSVDSYGLRLNQSVDDQIHLGLSYADAKLPNADGNLEHNQYVSAWLSTSHLIDGGTLKTTFVWGLTRAGRGAVLNSFLEEAVYQLGYNKFYGRVEFLQILPRQLDLAAVNLGTGAKWVKAFTAGYERTLFKKDELFLFAGGSYTRDLVPSEFTPAYGSNPQGFKVYLRIKFMADVSPTF